MEYPRFNFYYVFFLGSCTEHCPLLSCQPVSGEKDQTGALKFFSSVRIDIRRIDSIKQNGGMLAKGRLLGLQFLALFEDDLYYDICRAANEQAYRIAAACKEAGFAAKVLQPGEEMTL